MFNNVAIDVTIGLIFIFLIYSLLATIIQEIIARWFGLRPRTLLRALRRMLNDGDSNVDSTFLNFFIDTWNNIRNYFKPFEDKTFLKAFYEYPLIKYLGENNWTSKPSYISEKNFSEAMIHLLRGSNFNQSTNQMTLIGSNLQQNVIGNFSINAQTLTYLKHMWVDANNDIDKFKASLEFWFNATMERTTGWYKRQTQLILFLLGLGLAMAFNVDSIAIGKILAKDKNAREQIVNMAINRVGEYGKIIDTLEARKLPKKDSTSTDTVMVFVKEADTSLNSVFNSLRSDAKEAQLILGLGRCKDTTIDSVCIKKALARFDSLRSKRNVTAADIQELEQQFSKCQTCNEAGRIYQTNDGVVFVGWLITALAISLGAPFWFDLLNKIIRLRSTGNKPAETTASQDPKPATSPVNRVG